jgi:hypothetical protein
MLVLDLRLVDLTCVRMHRSAGLAQSRRLLAEPDARQVDVRPRIHESPHVLVLTQSGPRPLRPPAALSGPCLYPARARKHRRSGCRDGRVAGDGAAVVAAARRRRRARSRRRALPGGPPLPALRPRRAHLLRPHHQPRRRDQPEDQRVRSVLGAAVTAPRTFDTSRWVGDTASGLACSQCGSWVQSQGCWGSER